jgi:Cu2+-exporting ATPase
MMIIASGRESRILRAISEESIVPGEYPTQVTLTQKIERVRELRARGRRVFAAAGALALAYDPAAFGLIPPWLAALGMSLSSLGVVLNARRLAGRIA